MSDTSFLFPFLSKGSLIIMITILNLKCVKQLCIYLALPANISSWEVNSWWGTEAVEVKFA